MLKLSHVAVVVLLADAFREARYDLDVVLQRALQQLVNLAVVVVVVSDPEQTVDVVPYGAAEGRRVDVQLLAHPGVDGKYICQTKIDSAFVRQK